MFPLKLSHVRKALIARLFTALIPLFAGSFLPHVSFGASKGKAAKMTETKHSFFDSAALAYIREQIGGMSLEFVHVHHIECTEAKIISSGSRSERAIYSGKSISDGSAINFEHFTQGKLKMKPGETYIVVAFRESPPNLTLVSVAEADPKKFKPEFIQAEVARLAAEFSPPSASEKTVLLEHVRGPEAAAAMKYVLPPTITVSAKPPVTSATEVRLTVEVKNNGAKSENVIVFADKNPLHIRLIETDLVKYKPSALVPPEPPPPHRFAIEKGQVLSFTRVIKKSELDYKPSMVSIEWEFLFWSSPRPKGTWTVQL